MGIGHRTLSGARVMFEQLTITSPKRNKRLQTGWEGFFPYYAGFPEFFAQQVFQTAKLPADAVVLDPWNGSGTTTYSASGLGLRSVGLDLNPVMIIVARARLLAPSEADHLRPLAASILTHLRKSPPELDPTDALLTWFQPETARCVRGIEHNIRRSLVGGMTKSTDGVHLDRISGTAATLYVALFAACRRLVAPFRSSNPTWLRMPRTKDDRVAASPATIAAHFAANVRGMAAALAGLGENPSPGAEIRPLRSAEIKLANTTSMTITPASVDFVLTSPPYCTRIDYTAATRVELAALAPLLKTSARELGQAMIGSTQSPSRSVEVDLQWGDTCMRFLYALKRHPSKASAGYYYQTHLDYFDKMSRSLRNLAQVLRPGAPAVLVAQESYYKDLHNDLPLIISEMADGHGLELKRREDFHLRSMSDINPGRKKYARPKGATETVLCLAKK